MMKKTTEVDRGRKLDSKGAKQEKQQRALAALALLDLPDGPDTPVRAAPVSNDRKSNNSGGKQPDAPADARPAKRADKSDVPARPAEDVIPPKRVLEYGEPEPLAMIDGRPAPYYGTKINEANIPRKWEPGQLVRGDLVFYRGERFWVEYAPRDWETSHMVHIGDSPVPAGPVDPVRPLTQKRNVQAVHADCLLAAPQVKSVYGKLPTMASAARAERTKAGIRDVGDPIAVKLRGCKTLDDAYKVAAKMLGCPLVELKDRYGRLNPGQQRMNLGNRMRNWWKKNGGKEL